MGLTFENVWAAMMETDRLIKETEESQKETTAQIKALGKQTGDLGRSFGDLAEHLVGPNLVAKFQELQYPFTKSAYDVKLKDSKGNSLAEVDVWLENGDFALAAREGVYPHILVPHDAEGVRGYDRHLCFS
jgi:hypothetical protein